MVGLTDKGSWLSASSDSHRKRGKCRSFSFSFIIIMVDIFTDKGCWLSDSLLKRVKFCSSFSFIIIMVNFDLTKIFGIVIRTNYLIVAVVSGKVWC